MNHYRPKAPKRSAGLCTSYNDYEIGYENGSLALSYSMDPKKLGFELTYSGTLELARDRAPEPRVSDKPVPMNAMTLSPAQRQKYQQQYEEQERLRRLEELRRTLTLTPSNAPRPRPPGSR